MEYGPRRQTGIRVETRSIYKRPSDSVLAEHVVRKSRFIALVGPAETRAEAMRFVSDCAADYPDARHVCHAFIAGNPRSGPEVGSSDDGEPAGTAGRPILGVLEHNALGDVVAVVIRYFGGVKLGAGGLVRAYSTAVRQALDSLPLEVREPVRPLRLGFDFEFENRVRHLAGERGIKLDAPVYGRRVEMHAEPEASLAEEFVETLNAASSGNIEVTWISEDQEES